MYQDLRLNEAMEVEAAPRISEFNKPTVQSARIGLDGDTKPKLPAYMRHYLAKHGSPQNIIGQQFRHALQRTDEKGLQHIESIERGYALVSFSLIVFVIRALVVLLLREDCPYTIRILAFLRRADK